MLVGASRTPGKRSTRLCSIGSRSGCRTCRAISRVPPVRTGGRSGDQGQELAGLLPRDPALPVRYRREGLSDAGLTDERPSCRGEAVRARHESARQLAAELHQYIDESQLFRIDHYLGKMGLLEILQLRFANTMLEPVWNRNLHRERADRWRRASGSRIARHFYDPVGRLRDVVVNHLMQVVRPRAWKRLPEATP